MREKEKVVATGLVLLMLILLFGFIDFFAGVDQPIDQSLVNITAWHGRMQARPSATA